MYTLVVSVSVTDGGDNSSFLNLPQPCNTRMMQRRATLMRGYRLVCMLIGSIYIRINYTL